MMMIIIIPSFAIFPLFLTLTSYSIIIVCSAHITTHADNSDLVWIFVNEFFTTLCRPFFYTRNNWHIHHNLSSSINNPPSFLQPHAWNWSSSSVTQNTNTPPTTFKSRGTLYLQFLKCIAEFFADHFVQTRIPQKHLPPSSPKPLSH